MNSWKPISFWGSLRSGDPNKGDAAFHAGHINDVLRLKIAPYFPTLVAADSSGVWIVNETGGIAIPVSTGWDIPQLNCLSLGLYNAQHVYAAGGALYETDTTSLFPLLNWRTIPLPVNVGQIYRVLVVNALRKLVLAADGGIFSADIPLMPGSVYVFKQASLPGQRYSGLAEAAGNRVVAGAWGSDLKSHYGIFIGEWKPPAGNLIFNRSTITGSIDTKQMLRTEVVACAGDPSRLYAICGGGGDLATQLDSGGNLKRDVFGDVEWTGNELIYRILRSGDGGHTWQVTGSSVLGSTDKIFGSPKDVMGHTMSGYALCIGVSPFDRNLVAVGAVSFAISHTAGATWEVFTKDSSPHLHEDVHSLVFDQPNLAGVRLYICSDGGLASTAEPYLGKTFTTGWNRQLPNFQFTRFAASFRNSGVVGGALQDNGNVYTMLYVNSDPWKDLDGDGGDGVAMMFVESGQMVRYNNTRTLLVSGSEVEYGNKPRIAAWDDKERKFKDLKLFPNVPLSWGVVPVDATGDGLINRNHRYSNIIEVVDLPVWTNASGQAMLAVAAEDETVYGLFDRGGGKFIWNQLAVVPHKPAKDSKGNDQPYFATATASLDGSTILVGMNNGEIFQLAAPTWAAKDVTIPGNISPLLRFAIVDRLKFFALTENSLFHRDGTWKNVTPTTAADASFQAVVVNRFAPSSECFSASNSQVWASHDNGNTWTDITSGLPAAPQITDLRCAKESSGASFLYLSTWGWSSFRRLLDYDEIVRTITVDGHMDIVDRVAFGSDIWSHPTFSNVLHLGPLHPFEEAEYLKDDGDEVRIALKLHFDWHTDFSVNVRYEATLIAMDEDNYVDDQQSGSFAVPFNTTKKQSIDLASDELWPDRAHIEIKVSNP